jgi:cellulose synthase/poly-beta-1,6-N-acetylglucosamine synthase-like glycosyltransferase
MTHVFIAVGFWIALLLLVYLSVGYPAVAWLRASVSPRSHRREPIEPIVTVVVIAHNEADRIDARIQNLLALDYPPGRFDVIIASDGSTDDTAARARACVDSRVAVRAFRRRRGKAAVLNDVVPCVRGDIVVLADARQQFNPDTIRALVANFADPSVGVVSGELILGSASTATGSGACFYWRYEKFIRRLESRVDSTIGATGAIYAIRRPLFQPIPEDTILDDVLIPLRIMRQGYRVLLDPLAQAVDGPSSTARQEFARKTRTIAGTFQLLSREWWLLNPFDNRVWFAVLSHKALRLTLPLLQAAAFACSVCLCDLAFYRLMLIAQSAFYGAALVGWAQGPRSPHLRIFTAPYAMCLMSWATVIAFARFASGGQSARWELVSRPSVSPARRPPPQATRAMSRS